ncbi:ribokinase [Microbacterium sp. Se63.02b]|uniref:ribokinase n=1 Tax=Microbacterium sp. Se63.02b TaxID=2709304 RepID=UPI0016050B68|nr:ribokinase [Microbacterium sp. Se63.02b]QNA93877.1 ribokinase [Microbacterium sp. Se63.02b]
MTGRIVVVGSLNLDSTLRVDRLPEPGETLHSAPVLRAPGGKGANQAVAAALLGGRVALIGAVGDDDAGRTLATAVREAGVDVSAVRQVAGATGEATIIVDRGGENVIVVDSGVNALVDPRQVREDLVAGDVVVTGNELSDPVVVAAAVRASALGAVVVHNPSPFRALPDGMPHPQVLVVNEHEFARFGECCMRRRSRCLPALRGGAVVVTRGSRGALVLDEGAVTSVAAVRVDAVDTSGCGDAFLGALVERIAAGEPLVGAVRRAVLVGAYAATRRGAQSSYPTASDLDAWDAESGREVASAG